MLTFISRVELSANAASIGATNIPNTFQDLLIVMSLRSNRSDYADYFSGPVFNSNTSGYTHKIIGHFGSSGSQFQYSTRSGLIAGNTVTAGLFDSSQVRVFNYASSTQNKGFQTDIIVDNNADTAGLTFGGGQWANTAPITSVSFSPVFGTQLLAGSSLTLYGITSGSDGTTTVS